ncbi:MAG: hypothetical protein WD877_00170 [Candidatus Saccharimonadales bacterium]
MINLLPPKYANKLKVGLRKKSLVRLAMASFAAILVLIAIFGIGLASMNRQTKADSARIDSLKSQLKAQNLEQVQKDAQIISSDVRVINQVLSRQISFSALIQAIGQVMPEGTVLTSLTLTKIDGAIDLSAKATNHTAASRIAANLNDPANGLFSKVDIINISCSPAQADYECSVSLKALFSPDAKARFQNAASGGGG